jgi:hypothetical protein
MAYTTINDPSAYFQTALYTGNNTANHAITNDGNSDLQPDWLWIKSRDAAHSHWVVDSNRGVNKGFFVDAADAEKTSLATRDVASFDTDGFTVGVTYHSSSTNSNASTKVAWQWKANGGTTSSNTDGNTTTTVQANTTAGFSIVTYTGTGSSQTMGHGLGVTPNIVLTKNRSGTGRAWSFNGNIGPLIYGTNKLTLNQTTALAADTDDITAASSTTFTGGGSNSTNANTVTYVAYCFAEKQGYSKFGSYVGTGSTDGTFVYTGFKPAWVMVKQSNTARSWQIFDNKRDGYNKDYIPRLQADSDAAEAANTGASMDFVSNGFKLRTDQTGANQSGGTYIYMAFAENPFVTSTGIPTTAR